VPISCTPASTWPAKFAYLSASIFIAASGSVNLLYGVAKGQDPANAAVWGTVSVAASITFALSWPALIKARSLSRAMVAIVAMLLSGGYSISAALGSAGASTIAVATRASRRLADRNAAPADRADCKLRPARQASPRSSTIRRRP
jgi:hypothetical protein